MRSTVRIFKSNVITAIKGEVFQEVLLSGRIVRISRGRDPRNPE